MAVTSIVNNGSSLQITEGSLVFFVFKQEISSINYQGDNVYITQYNGERVVANYTEVTTPSEASAQDLAATVSGYISTSSDIGTGWAQYSDTIYTSINKFAVTAGSTLDLPNNAGAVINSQLPSGVSSFYDSGTTKITPESSGDSYSLRVSFSCDTSSNIGYGELILDIGGAQGEILRRSISFPRGTGITRGFSSSNLIYSLGTFIANGGQLKIEGFTGTTQIWDIVYVIERTYKSV